MGKVKPFTQQEYDLAIQMSVDARMAFRTGRYNQRDLRVAYDFIREIIHYPPMTDEHFEWLLEGLKQ